MTNIYDVIDAVHDMMEKIVGDPSVCHDTVIVHDKIVVYHITKDCLFFKSTQEEWEDRSIRDSIEGSLPWREWTTETEHLLLGDYHVVLRSDDNWVDDLVQKYFA